jgi:glucokinase
LGDIPFLPGWQGPYLVQALEGIYDIPAKMENDADSAALAEGVWGSGKGSRVFIYVTVSTGIGSGMLIDGRLYRGAGGAHPEIGHHVLDPGGPACSCGSRGCWESLASGPALADWYKARLPGGAPRRVDAREVCRLAKAGDPLAQEAVARTARYIGMGLGNLINFYTPDRIALGGGLMNAWPLFEPVAQSIIPQVCTLVPYAATTIAPASLGPETPLLGAAQAFFQARQFGN